MVRKLKTKYLTQDELTYELLCRGIGLGTVDEMRKSLAQAQRLEQDGDSVSYPEHPFTHEQDVEAIGKKIDELSKEIESFVGNRSSSSFQRLHTKLYCVLNRIERMPAADSQKSKSKSSLLATALSVMDSLVSKAEEVESKGVVELVVLESTRGQTSFNADLPGVARTSSMENIASPPVLSSTSVKPILPNKWGISFSGDRKGISITAFFERVDELSKARGVSKAILLDSGIDLFAGRAYQFYLDVRREVSSWNELVLMFKAEYQPADYNERLFEEIKRRTQGVEESIGTYLAVMSKYFQRLECPISEHAKLKILMRNIAPYYQTHLGLVDVGSIAQLRELCRRLDERRHTASNFVTPPRSKGSLEPDLAYVECEESVDALEAVPRTSSGSSQDVVCYRCNQTGHRAIGCAQNRNRVCFRCGKEGHTVVTCPNCNKSSGNGSRRPRGADSRT